MKPIRLKLNPKPYVEKKEKFAEIDIFEAGTLLQFETHAWQARKRLPQEMADKIAPSQKQKAASQWIRANKSLIDRKHLVEINAIISESRQFVWDTALPFPIKALHLIANDRIALVKERMDGYIAKLKKAVNDFNKQYQAHIKEAETLLKPFGIFNPMDYPQSVKDKFSITYRFFDLTIPKHVSNEMRQEEVSKFQALMGETKEMGILALREGFAEIITHLTDTLSGKLDGEKKRLNQKAIDKVEEFFTQFQSKNIFKDDQLEEIIVKAKDILEGVSSTDIREDKDLTKIINSELTKVKKELDGSIQSFKRKVTFI